MLPRLLFYLAAGMSLVLILFVIISPVLHGRLAEGNRWSRLLAVFAQDPTLRRTASAGAIGLLVTACVFFRQPASGPHARPKQRRPPQDMAGA